MDPEVSQPGKRSLKSALTRGSLWSAVGYAGSQAIRLGGHLILWRLLYPKAFGIMAIVNVFMQGLQMFSDVGIGPSIIQHKRGDDPTYLNTAWTIQAIRGLALFVASAVAAAPLARFYDEPQLAYLIPVVGLGAAIAGLNSTNLFAVVRKISLGRLTVIDLSSQVAGLIVMVGWAYIYRSIWGLAVGSVVTNVARLIMGHLMLPGIKNRPLWDAGSARTLLRFGRWIFLSTLLTFAVGQSDRLIFGKLVPIELLGVYSIATIWSGLPTAILERVFSSVLFPVLSRIHNAGGNFQAAFREVRTPSLLVAGWMSACLVAGGPTLVRFLYDTRATDAGWIVQTLAAGTWFLTLETTNGTALLAQGKANWVAIGSASKLVGMAVAIPVGFALGGFRGAVYGFAASELCRYVASVMGALTIDLRGYGQDLQLSAVLAATAGMGWLAGQGAHSLLATFAVGHPRQVAFLEGVIILLVAGAGWAGLYLFHRARRRHTPSVLD
ncbi:MAG: oligosaccharide flippase family protein [Verrucomicrobiota bacterium]